MSADSNGWLPIKTAPKDGTRLLLFYAGNSYGYAMIFGNWDDDRYSRKPRPYWTHDLARLYGITHARAHQPTHWQPLPKPPGSAA